MLKYHLSGGPKHSLFFLEKIIVIFADLGKWAPFQCQERKNKFIRKERIKLLNYGFHHI